MAKSGRSAKRHPRIGKHTFETLTTGMYTNPLDAYREYIQNSVDAIEASARDGQGRIDIEVTPSAREIRVRDNGSGIPAAEVARELEDVGRSRKRGQNQRGFRGIGRLGGLAYCEELVFRTKSDGEAVVSTQVWNCAELRDLLRPGHPSDLDMHELIETVSSISTSQAAVSDPGFFEVCMLGVGEELMLDIPRVKHHLRQVAPVDFDSQQFHFASEIRRYLQRSVPSFVTMDLLVNNDVILKPYGDSVPLSRGPRRKRGSARDAIQDIETYVLEGDRGNALAHAWIAKTGLKGMVDDASGVNGIRMRVGNIGLGDHRALEPCFPKSNVRFAGYLVGEIHAIDVELKPNARRDGFEANERLRDLYDACARQLCHPKSKSIREASKTRTE